MARQLTRYHDRERVFTTTCEIAFLRGLFLACVFYHINLNKSSIAASTSEMSIDNKFKPMSIVDNDEEEPSLSLSYYGGLLMKYNYYTWDKMGQIILDLILLYYEMEKDGYTDRDTLKGMSTTIDMLKYYRQFLRNDKKGK